MYGGFDTTTRARTSSSGPSSEPCSNSTGARSDRRPTARRSRRATASASSEMSVAVDAREPPFGASASAIAPDPVPTSIATPPGVRRRVLEHEIDELLGLRARNQHALVDLEREVAERSRAPRRRRTARPARAARRRRSRARARRASTSTRAVHAAARSAARRTARRRSRAPRRTARRCRARRAARAAPRPAAPTVHAGARGDRCVTRPSPSCSSTSASLSASMSGPMSPSMIACRSCDVKPMRWSVTRLCGKLYVRILADRSPVPTCVFACARAPPPARATRRSSSRARSTSIALSLFWSCDFWSCWLTTSPVGMCVMRTAESVVFTLCPPGPDDAEDVDAEVLVLDLDVDLFGLGQHGDRRRRGVDAPLRSRSPARAARGARPTPSASRRRRRRRRP